MKQLKCVTVEEDISRKAQFSSLLKGYQLMDYVEGGYYSRFTGRTTRSNYTKSDLDGSLPTILAQDAAMTTSSEVWDCLKQLYIGGDSLGWGGGIRIWGGHGELKQQHKREWYREWSMDHFPFLNSLYIYMQMAQTPRLDLISRNCDDGNGFVNPSAIDGPLPLPFPFIYTIECATTHKKF